MIGGRLPDARCHGWATSHWTVGESPSPTTQWEVAHEVIVAANALDELWSRACADVGVEAVRDLADGAHPDASLVGIVLAALSLAVIPVLGGRA
jgi:hypothetical protein